jgi:hypothetical protein
LSIGCEECTNIFFLLAVSNCEGIDKFEGLTLASNGKFLIRILVPPAFFAASSLRRSSAASAPLCEALICSL